MTLKRSVVPGEYYHLFNQGAGVSDVFKEKADYERFLFTLLYLQSPLSFKNISRIINGFSFEDGFPVSDQDIEKILKSRFVELVSFCILPTYFHILIREISKDGMSLYMQRVSEAYTKYFNGKYNASGHVFQGRYDMDRIADDQQLIEFSVHVHRIPRTLEQWKGKEEQYPWSSLQDFTRANRWGGLIVPDVIVGHFDTTPESNYADFVKTMP